MTEKLQSKRKLFYVKDLFFYLIAFLIIVGLTLAFIVFPNSSTNFSGFKVTVNNKTALTYSFDGEIFIAPEFADKIEVSPTKDTFTIYSSLHKGGYNVIKIDKTAKTATVLESNCSNSKDCVYSPDISSNGAIYCAPHALKITAIGGSDFIPPTAG